MISFWESEEVAERSRVARLQLRDRITSTVSVEVQETEPDQVAFAELGSLGSCAADGRLLGLARSLDPSC